MPSEEILMNAQNDLQRSASIVATVRVSDTLREVTGWEKGNRESNSAGGSQGENENRKGDREER